VRRPQLKANEATHSGFIFRRSTPARAHLSRHRFLTCRPVGLSSCRRCQRIPSHLGCKTPPHPPVRPPLHSRRRGFEWRLQWRRESSSEQPAQRADGTFPGRRRVDSVVGDREGGGEGGGIGSGSDSAEAGGGEEEGGGGSDNVEDLRRGGDRGTVGDREREGEGVGEVDECASGVFGGSGTGSGSRR